MTFDEIYTDLREGVKRAIVGVDPAELGTDRTFVTCRCGRPAYLGASDGVPRCPACEYLPCETCDCVSAD